MAFLVSIPEQYGGLGLSLAREAVVMQILAVPPQLLRLYEGTSQVQQLIIARQMGERFHERWSCRPSPALQRVGTENAERTHCGIWPLPRTDRKTERPDCPAMPDKNEP